MWGEGLTAMDSVFLCGCGIKTQRSEPIKSQKRQTCALLTLFVMSNTLIQLGGISFFRDLESIQNYRIMSILKYIFRNSISEIMYSSLDVKKFTIPQRTSVENSIQP
jgi:hypothetical protein